jgi:signal transduction histidine kinase
MNPWWIGIGVVGGFLLGGLAVGAVLRCRARHKASCQDGAEDRVVADLAQLAGGLAHEIKNPLSTINVNLELLAEDLRDYKDVEHQRWLRRLDNVRNETDRLRATLDDFLRFAGKYELRCENRDLRDIAGQLIDFFAPQTQINHVVLRHSLPDTPIICPVDEKVLKQALLNLMINANEAMHEGGELLVRVDHNATEGLIEVIDTGPGIAPEELDRIFDVYYSNKSGGSGLGLPTTRRIVAEHAGRLDVDSEPGRGTRFTIALPLAR